MDWESSTNNSPAEFILFPFSQYKRGWCGIGMAAILSWQYPPIYVHYGFGAKEMALHVRSSSPHVLVVDDDASNLIIAQSLLQHQGCTVVGCDDFAGAIRALQANSFNLALIDINMPEGSGSALSVELQHIDPELACIAFTADTDYQQQLDFLHGGFRGLLVKPISPDSLTRLLNEQGMTPGNGPVLSKLAALPNDARERYITLMIRDVSRSLESLRNDPKPEARQRALHSLVGVLGTAGARGYDQAVEAERLERDQLLTSQQLNSLLLQIDRLLSELD
ncbi:response regulator [Halopseudomonas pelagia]|uniref:response regulator n=1 Tax=Halopseudomonas pelagia TaxID=553151 RepID=UPI001E41B952|nr:response regulator [Halopseudomonas pelagia]